MVCSRPEAEPACSGLDAGEHGRGDRHEHQAGREAVEQHRPEDRAEVGVAGADVAEQHEAGRQAERADHHQRAGAEPARPGRGDPRHREDAEAERQEREAGRERAEAEHALDVLHDQEEHRQLAADTSAITASAATRWRLRSRRGLDQRVRDAGRSVRASTASRATPSGEAAEGARGDPAVLGGADQRPDERDGAEGGGDGADDVEAAGAARRSRRRSGGRARSTAMPIGTLMNSVQRHEPTSVSRPPSSSPMRGAAGGDGAEQRERAVAGGLVGGAGGEQGEHARGGQRGADALERRGRRRAGPGVWARPPSGGGEGEERRGRSRRGGAGRGRRRAGRRAAAARRRRACRR